MSDYSEKLARIKGELETNPHCSVRGLASKYEVGRSVVKRIRRNLAIDVDYVETSDGRTRSLIPLAELATIDPEPTQQVFDIIPAEVAELMPLNAPRALEKPEVWAKAKLTSEAAKNIFDGAIAHIARKLFHCEPEDHPWEQHGQKAAAIVYNFLFTEYDGAHNTAKLHWDQYMKVLRANTRLPDGEQPYLGEREYRFIDEDYKPKSKRGENAAREAMPSEWNEMLSRIDTTNDVGKMDYAVMMCCFPLGIRISDIAYLSVDYFNPDRNTLYVANVKVKTPFEKPLRPFPDRAAWAIAAWLNVRGKQDTDSMFFEKRTGPGTEQIINWDKPLRRRTDRGRGKAARTVGARIKRLAKSCGFEDISSHCGRVTACNSLRRDGWDVIPTTKLMGWSDPKMVMKYDRMSIDEFLKPEEVPDWNDAFLHPYVA